MVILLLFLEIRKFLHMVRMVMEMKVVLMIKVGDDWLLECDK